MVSYKIIKIGGGGGGDITQAQIHDINPKISRSVAA